MSKRIPSPAVGNRLAAIHAWLDDNAPYARFDQRHLDPGTPEQAYWHLGYVAALEDLRVILQPASAGRRGRPSRSRMAGRGG